MSRCRVDRGGVGSTGEGAGRGGTTRCSADTAIRTSSLAGHVRRAAGTSRGPHGAVHTGQGAQAGGGSRLAGWHHAEAPRSASPHPKVSTPGPGPGGPRHTTSQPRPASGGSPATPRTHIARRWCARWSARRERAPGEAAAHAAALHRACSGGGAHRPPPRPAHARVRRRHRCGRSAPPQPVLASHPPWPHSCAAPGATHAGVVDHDEMQTPARQRHERF